MPWHPISVAVVSWLVQTQWWFSINTILFCMLLSSFRYLQTSRTHSTKPFMKRLSGCGAKWTFIFIFFAICSPTAQSCTMVHFPWSWTRSDTFTLSEDAPQNCSWNSWTFVELSELLYSCFFAICSPTTQSLTMVCFVWYWTRWDTFRLLEDVPQNHLGNGQAVVEASSFYIHVFCHKLTNCSVTYYGPFSMILDSFGYLHTPRIRSLRLFMKRWSSCGAKWTFIFIFFAICSPTAQSCTMVYFHDLGLVWIPSHSPKTLHKTVYEMVERLWRKMSFYIRVFCHMLTNYSVTYHGLFCMILSSFGYLHTPWRRSTKLFTKRLSCCRAKEASISCFLP